MGGVLAFQFSAVRSSCQTFFSYRVMAGCTSTPSGRHTDGWRCSAALSRPEFIGIKVVQYQGSVGIFAEPLVSIQVRGRGSIL